MFQKKISSAWGTTFQYKMTGWKYSVGVRFLLFLFLTILFYFSLAPHLVPEKYNIKVGLPSEKQILAPAQVANNKATLKAQEQAAEQVQPIYKIVPIRNQDITDAIMARIEQLNQDDAISFTEKVEIYRKDIPLIPNQYIVNFINNNRSNYSASLLDEMRAKVTEQEYKIPEETYIKIARLTPEDIISIKETARTIVIKLMNDQITDAQTVRAKVAEQVNISSLNKRATREVVQELVRFALTPNKFYDEEGTKEAKVQARENTQTVFIKQGDIVVHKGEMITPELYQLLGELDLLTTDVNYWPQFGVLIMSVLFSLMLFMFIRQSGGTGFKFNNAQLLMLVVIFFLNLVAMQIVGLWQTKEASYIGYIAPVAMGVMLVTLLLDMSLAFISAFIFSIIASIIFNVGQGQIFDFHYGFVAAVVSFASVFAIHRASQRSTILKAGIMICLFGSLSVAMLAMINGDSFVQRDVLYAIGFAFASGLLTAVFVVGLMPFFEITFGILSALKLVELSNPNHPLLRKLLTETPGTYHHSVMVGNLSEAAAEAIGADGLLCRVGSFYHDIGKTKRPSYFIENQTNIENPHDAIEPKLSKSIITAHPRDGVEMLKDYKIPKPIRDIAEQHHGTTFLKFFYYKALKQAEEQGVEPDFTEDDFRYPGPKAQSKESAIVGISDCVEAAVRSLRNPTVDQIEAMIAKIIRDRLDDSQYNECDLTMKELDTVAHSLKETVMGIFHSRIEYPDEVKAKTKS
ncbi:metal-dependent phosphohydrolase [Paenibacillus selenitireducens]|uniref:Metal-dependent phosphohydrolase n=1 Tax=Paenibacillus selenitireducens TaxID=1324314 RepID=A0A1T2XF29_9BACL|nr:HDIG domain-containing metalloprotein [Paenibacillus selenitireducens]OPA78412.1 metal-dependent phosphohydrolase [Paenibacillus selenitireducens]